MFNDLKKFFIFFQKNNINYALIGGLAIINYGVKRNTLDLDILLHEKHINQIKEYFNENNYSVFYESDNVIQLTNPKGIPIDILIAKRKYTYLMLKRANIINLFDTKVKILKPEDIIGLKIQALFNDPERKEKDMFDIKMLIKENKNINWEIIKEYFQIFDMIDEFESLKKEYKNA